MIFVLTSHPDARPCVELLRAARERGIAMRAGPIRRFTEQDVVFAYGASRALLGALGATSALVVNGVSYSKHQQYERLAAAGIPVPRWQRAPRGPLGPEALLAIGGPVIVKPDFGGFGNGVRLVSDPARFEPIALRRAHVLQEFIPCGGRCARVVVLGDRVAATIDRVARDGVVAAYAGGKRGWLEPFHPTPEESRLCIRAAQVLGIEVAGVDLVRSARGPHVLEVNHRFVPYHLRAMYGDVLGDIAAYLESRHRARGAPRPRPPRSWRLPRPIGAWMTAKSNNERIANGRR